MSDALMSSSLVHKVDDGLATNTHDGSSDDHAGCNTLSHGCVVGLNATFNVQLDEIQTYYCPI